MARILVIGAVALDRPIWLNRPLYSGGRAYGRSKSGSLEGRLGGGGANAGCALHAAGHQVVVAAILANDADGVQASRLAEAAGLDLSLTTTRPGTSSRTLILIDPAGERTIIGIDGLLRDEETPRPSIALPSSDGDFHPCGLFIRTAYDGAAEWAAVVRGPVLLHWPAPHFDGEADVVVASADDLTPEVAASPYEIARAQLGPQLTWVVVTHGANGAVAHGPDRRISAPVPRREARDTTGAGDIFAAGLLDALIAGAPMEQALEHACRWGGAAVLVEGSAPDNAPKGTFRAFSAA
ncbi:MAG: carbohydrate kinase family protein [Sphingomonadaceae bacterium]